MNANSHSLRRTILAWEKQRILYTAFVASFVAWRIGRFPFWPDPGLWQLFLLLIAVANVFYCVGPLIEVYALLFTGIQCERARILLLGGGLLFSATLMALAF